MFLPYDEVIIMTPSDPYYNKKVIIVETHINMDGTTTYITTAGWDIERKESELELHKKGNWHKKVFKNEFEPGDKVKWTSKHYVNVSTITQKIYFWHTSRIYYHLSCNLTFTSSKLRLCKGGI